ncbi:sensor histidine kinase [Longispora albida]|uniref:sensor histidine kinase n=1 Tax=Longispora albida TaxID=203523 RepID=UPI00037653D0|nr:ATP-binding protein [Longispora albida]
MRDVLFTFLMALAGSLAVGGVGALVLRRLRGRSFTVYVCVLLGVVVLSVAAGVLGAAYEMFISAHDLHVLLIVIGTAGAVALGVAVWQGRRLAAESMWTAQAEATRRELVAWVSHDLRTPLAGMRAMAEALEDGIIDDPATVTEYHRRIRTETDRMAGLVDDLLELSRINAGALRLTLSTVAIGDLVSDAIAGSEPVAAAQHVRLIAARGDWPAAVGSEPELSRVLSNLLMNAIRHTPEDGSVTITGGKDGDGAWFAVTDSCGGIPQEDLPRVFEVAFRGEQARTPGGGAGLGLAIVRGLVEAQHGHVGVVNVGGGCRFEVRLPVPG